MAKTPGDQANCLRSNALLCAVVFVQLMPSSLVQRKLLYAILLRSLQMNVGHLGPAAVVGHHIVAGLEYFDRRCVCLAGRITWTVMRQRACSLWGASMQLRHDVILHFMLNFGIPPGLEVAATIEVIFNEFGLK